MLPAAPGDVLAVWTGTRFTQEMIRVEAALEGKPGVASHVVGITHQDAEGRWIGIEGRPGGVGLVDCTPYLRGRLTRTNHGQPRPDDRGQLAALLASAAKSVGIAYDWVGIAEDGLDAIRLADLSAVLDHLWRWPAGHGQLPGDVVCSSLWAMLYDLPQVGWAHPRLGAERNCDPGDWWAWSDSRAWEQER